MVDTGGIQKNCLGLYALIFAVLALSFVQLRPGSKINQIFPVSAPHLVGISIAISEFEYGLKPGFVGYRRINRNLLDFTRTTCRYGTCTYSDLNQAIGEILQLKEVEQEGLHYMFGVDPGMPMLYKAAFSLFGYRAEAPWYFVFGLLLVSVLGFLFAYHQHISLVFLLLVFLGAHLVAAHCAPFSSPDLQVIFHDRFLPVYALIPALHLGLAALFPVNSQQRRWQKWRGTALLLSQAILLNIFIHARFAALGVALSVIAFPLALLSLKRVKRYAGPISLQPALCFLMVTICFRAFIFTSLHPNYSQFGERPFHGFWHNFFIGMGAHPEAESRYGLRYDDMSGFKIAEKLAPQHGYTFNVEKHVEDHDGKYGYYVIGVAPESPSELVIQGKRYSDVLASEYFRILREDPGFVLMSYLHKVPMFFRVFLNLDEEGGTHDHFGAPQYIFHPLVLICLMLGFYLARGALMKDYVFLFGLLGYLWFFSLLAPMAVIPQSHLIAESSVVLIMLVYTFLFFSCEYFWQATKKKH